MTGKNVSTAVTMSQSKDTKRSVSYVSMTVSVVQARLDHHGVSCNSTARVTTN